jgi:RNA polymerase sigma factor (TIGR02999 family)
MRQILVNHARDRGHLNRGGRRRRVGLERIAGSAAAASADDDFLLDPDEALDGLANEYPRAADLVKLRPFAGRTLDEAAAALGISRRTAHRDWNLARAWLADALGGDAS